VTEIPREAIVVPAVEQRNPGSAISARGRSFSIHEWRGSGPGYLHVHHSDDEAWHVLEGSVRFRFADKEIDAAAGTTVLVPAGVAHDHQVLSERTRYLIILTPRLDALIAELHSVPFSAHRDVMRRYDSEIVE
jgi:mannose-6-phosphate isomerase-like protein (cupin superfamily)